MHANLFLHIGAHIPTLTVLRQLSYGSDQIDSPVLTTQNQLCDKKMVLTKINSKPSCGKSTYRKWFVIVSGQVEVWPWIGR